MRPLSVAESRIAVDDTATGRRHDSVASWLGDAVYADIVQLRDCVLTKHRGRPKNMLRSLASGNALLPMFKATVRSAYQRFFARLQTTVMQVAVVSSCPSTPTGRRSLTSSTSSASGSLNNSMLSSVFDSAEYRTAQAYILADVARTRRFFAEATHTAAPRLERGVNTALRSSSGKIVLNLDGPHKHRWYEFATGRHSYCLAELIVHVEQGACTSRQAAERVIRMASIDAALETKSRKRSSSSEDLRGAASDEDADADDDEDAPIASAAAQPAANASATRKQEKDRQAFCRALSRMERAVAGSVGSRYLRVTRGLLHAPEELIERNSHIYMARRIKYTFQEGDPREPLYFPALVFPTRTCSAIQRIYLDEATARKQPESIVDSPKKTLGTLAIAPDYSDPVPLQERPPSCDIAFIAEGVETGLSVAYALPGACVYASLGINNIEFVAIEGAHTGIWCRENDAAPHGAQSAPPGQGENFNAVARERIARRDGRIRAGLRRHFSVVYEIFPPAEDGDFNDTLCRLPRDTGPMALRVHLLAQLPASFASVLVGE